MRMLLQLERGAQRQRPRHFMAQPPPPGARCHFAAACLSTMKMPPFLACDANTMRRGE